MAHMDPNRLCPNCMSEKAATGQVCPVCGCDPAAMDHSPRCLLPMTILAGKYLLGGVLGEGGFGITYMGWDLVRECRVAVKEYFPSALAVRDTVTGQNNTVRSISGEQHVHFVNGLAKFREEAQNLMQLRNLGSIVTVLDYFQENDTAYIVMEYINGVTLKTYLETHGGCLTEQQALEMLRPLIEAMAQVHQTGLIHRDISPDNIMVCPDGTTRLIDFGAARMATGEQTQSLTVILKHGYAPEEQYRSRGRQGPFTDVYAMSAVVYKLLTGETPADAMARVLEDELPPLASYPNRISQQTIRAVEKGMAVRAENRWQTMGQLAEALYHAPTGKAVSVKAPKRPVARPRRNAKTWLWVGGLAVLAALLALGVSALSRTGSASAQALRIAREAAQTAPPVSGPAVPEPVQPTESAADRAAAENLTWETNDTGLTITGMAEEREVLYLPSAIQGTPVTAVGDHAFYGCRNLKQLDLPEGLEAIGAGAFSDCLSLETLTLPEGLRIVGDGAFANCTALETLTLPSTLEAIGDNAFQGCMNLTGADLPEGCQRLGSCAFEYCLFAETFTLPESLQEIGPGAFTGCDRAVIVCVAGSPAELYLQGSAIAYEVTAPEGET